MRSHFFQRLHASPVLSKRDLALTLLLGLLWAAAVSSRPYLLQASCVQRPENCAATSVPALDRPALGLDSTPADQYSDLTQRTAGILAVSAPLVWNGVTAALGRITPATALLYAGQDTLLVLQSAFLNGVGTEAAHALIQRPRPYVFANPEMAKNPTNYTSFYSGHTSFAAATTIALLLILLSRGAPTPLLLLAGAVSQSLILSTAFFRVLAGRHFISDVLVGAIMGAAAALVIATLHRPRWP